MTEAIAFVDGQLVPRHDATVSIDDAAVRYGAACFETMRATNGRVFRLHEHLSRLRTGLEAMGVPPPPSSTLADAIAATLEANALSEARLRLSVSAGLMTTPDLTAAGPFSVVVVADPIAAALAPPLALAVSSLRVDAERPLASAKTAQYLVYLLARAEARRAGADDALLLNGAGEVCETSAANLFAVFDGQIVTPPLGAGPLPGVTRSAILEIADREGSPVVERALTLDALVDADELFVTNSIIGTRSVASVATDGVARWSGAAPGAVTTRIGERYNDLVEAETGANVGS